MPVILCFSAVSNRYSSSVRSPCNKLLRVTWRITSTTVLSTENNKVEVVKNMGAFKCVQLWFNQCGNCSFIGVVFWDSCNVDKHMLCSGNHMNWEWITLMYFSQAHRWKNWLSILHISVQDTKNTFRTNKSGYSLDKLHWRFSLTINTPHCVFNICPDSWRNNTKHNDRCLSSIYPSVPGLVVQA